MPVSRPWPVLLTEPEPPPLDEVVYVNAFARLPLDPLGLVTVTLTVPEPAGVRTLIWLALMKVTAVQLVDPNLTPAPLWKLDPYTVTAVPPEVDPLEVESDVTVGVADPEEPDELLEKATSTQ